MAQARNSALVFPGQEVEEPPEQSACVFDIAQVLYFLYVLNDILFVPFGEHDD